MVLGEPIHVPRDASEAALEAARLAVERGLDAVHERAYALVGSPRSRREDERRCRRSGKIFGAAIQGDRV